MAFDSVLGRSLSRYTVSKSPRRSVRHFVVLVLAGGAVGCGSSQQASKQLDSIHSWTATAQLARQEFDNGALPAKFTVGIAEQAHRALTESRMSFQQSNPTPAQLDSARAATHSLELAIRDLDASTRAR